MQKHAMALGYFFLAAICIFVSSHCFVAFRIPLLVAALAATIAGFGFVFVACSAQLRAIKKWLTALLQIARQPPTRQAKARDEHTA